MCQSNLVVALLFIQTLDKGESFCDIIIDYQIRGRVARGYSNNDEILLNLTVPSCDCNILSLSDLSLVDAQIVTKDCVERQNYEIELKEGPIDEKPVQKRCKDAYAKECVHLYLL